MIEFVLFAYIDPGTGSAIIQAVIGGIAAAGFFFRHHVRTFIHKIITKISKNEKK